MRILLAIFLSLFLVNTSIAQEVKSFKDNPEEGRNIAHISTCKIIYFNLALYLSISENINIMFNEDAENKNIGPAYDTVVKNFRTLFDLQVKEGTRLVNEGFNPYEIDFVVSEAEGSIVQVLSMSLSQMVDHPDKLKPMIESMIQQTDSCDSKFLN